MSKKVRKRDGRLANFDKHRIVSAIRRAVESTDGETWDEYFQTKADNIANYIKNEVEKSDDVVNIEHVQDLVENGLMNSKRGKDVARNYIIYRNKRSEARTNTIDDTVKDYLGGTSEYWNYENSNKDAKVLSTQRDYLAGILSTDYSRRYLLPLDVVKAHDEGILHFHDIDYFAENAITNCSLINLEDMLQNGTIVNGIRIDKPHRFITACTIATQIILGVTSNQYGGTTVSITHLAPFLRDSYNWYLNKYRGYGGLTAEQILDFAKKDTKKELEDGVQTFNYQLNSMTNSNGQSPFVSVFMYLNESPEYKKEIALITEEFFKQRILGFKNEVGVYITPAFPKLLYVLEEDNITPDSKYWYLTKLAAECTAKRMVPDYISEKKMKELKNGDCFPCMGGLRLTAHVKPFEPCLKGVPEMVLTDRATKLSPWEVINMMKPVSTISDECKRVGLETSASSKRKAMQKHRRYSQSNRCVEVFLCHTKIKAEKVNIMAV